MNYHYHYYIKQSKITTFFFLLAYTTFYSFSMFGHIEGAGGILKYSTYIGIAILIAVFLMRLRDYKAKEGIACFTLILWTLFIGYHTGDYGFFKLTLMITAAKNIGFEDCIKYDVFLRIFTIALMFILWKAGIAPDFTSILGATVRHSMGFRNLNHFGMLVFILVLECLYLAHLEFHLLLYVVLIAVLVFEDRIAGSRTAEVFSVFALFFAVIYSHNRELFKSGGWRIFMQMNAPVCFILTELSSYVFSHSADGLMVKLNTLLSGRIYNIAYYNNLFGPTIFGVNIASGNRTLDNLYAYLIISSGIVVFIFIMIAYIRLIYDLYMYDNVPMAVVIFLLFAYGLSERLWFQIDYNLLMLSFKQLLYHDVVQEQKIQS